MKKLREQLLIEKIQDKSTSSALKKKMSTLLRQNRRYLLTNSGVLIYPSKNGIGQKLNGKVLDHISKKITCRHLSGYLVFKSARGIKHYHENYGSREAISQIRYLRENEYDAKDRHKIFGYYAIFSCEQLGGHLKQVARCLKPGEETRLLLDTENHLMVFTLLHKPLSQNTSHYVIKFYDPNNTDKHSRAIAPSLGTINTLTMDEFLTQKKQRRYFKTFQTCVLSATKEATHNIMTSVTTDDIESIIYFSLELNLSSTLSHYLNKLLIDNPPDLEKKLSATNLNKQPALFIALQNGNDQVVKIYIETILRASLSEETKFKLIYSVASHDKTTNSALSQALLFAPSRTIEAYLDTVLWSALSNKQKLTILYARFGLCPGILPAFILLKYENLISYFSAIFTPKYIPPLNWARHSFSK